MIAREIGSRALIVAMSPMRDEVRGLMQSRLYVESPPLGTTKLSDWVRAFRLDIGSRYTSDL